jgi:radical SAM superfamily enzyme YgiQ (UPF0313 family)
MSDIVLTTFNARYAHASFGLRYLLANLPPQLREGAAMLEFEINQRPTDAIEKILAHDPKIVGVGVYIWNAPQSAQLVAELKRVRPEVTVIVGGPEVSYEVEEQEICRVADYVITGEADLAFADVCEALLSRKRPLMKVVAAELPEFGRLALPYEYYNDEDVAHRVIYVEASRGCPFKCEFCLSSLDVPVRNVPLDAFLGEMQKLLDRGVSQFKFVDRTFNLNVNIGRAILEFFFERHRPGLFLHFEMIPDRLPEALRGPIAKFPPGALQFEVGIQTFNEEVAHLISRRQDNAKVEENLRWLREHTGVHIHTDLIAGLPGENLDSFGRGFDRLVPLRPQEIQVGILKRLRGTAIVRHDQAWEMVYSPNPPYEVLRTKLIDFATMQRLRRFARYWDLVANSGNFGETTAILLEDGSPFESFMSFSEWLYERLSQRTHGIPLEKLAELIFVYLTSVRNGRRDEAAPIVWRDYSRGARRDVPKFLRPYISERPDRARVTLPLPKRQSRHLASNQQGASP